MQVLVQHSETGRFWAGGKGWAEREKAVVFASTLHALRCCSEHRLCHATVLLSFGPSRYDIHLDPFGTEELKKA
jgi:hypothetical protein